MAALPVFQLNKARLEKLSPQDKEAVEKMANQSRQGLEEIIKILNPDKYPKARSYLLNLKKEALRVIEWVKMAQFKVPPTYKLIFSALNTLRLSSRKTCVESLVFCC